MRILNINPMSNIGLTKLIGGSIILSRFVIVPNRHIRTEWGHEMVHDISAFRNLDAEAEMIAILSEEIRGEIDRTILNNLRGNTMTWEVLLPSSSPFQILPQSPVSNKWIQHKSPSFDYVELPVVSAIFR